jgi:hypothetical protein
MSQKADQHAHKEHYIDHENPDSVDQRLLEMGYETNLLRRDVHWFYLLFVDA